MKIDYPPICNVLPEKYSALNPNDQWSINELIFNSLREASLFLKICVPTLRKRIESDDLKWISWNYIQFEDNLKR